MRVIIAAVSLLSLTVIGIPARAAAGPVTTFITIDGNGGGPAYGGVGAVLGGGGTARYLEEYPPAQRTSILKYLFKPGYGASLQILKLEIGGDVNSSDGSEPSVEHTAGHINCDAGYEFAIARQAVALNPNLKLYGLQWGAPGWAGRSGSLFTSADIGYLLDWLGCARKQGLAIGYLGGWDERDDGSHGAWFHSLRAALDAGGYQSVQIVADDGTHPNWEYAWNKAVGILGAHNNCGYPTGKKGARTKCFGSWAASHSGKPLWASELGAMDGGAQAGCQAPCAPAMDRAFTREYIDAGVTGALVWPAIESMPAAVLRYENEGLVTADQPWSGNFRVNAMTWVIAHITQFAWPPTAGNPGGWQYLSSAGGYLQHHRVNGSYVTLVPSTRDQWSTIIETTAGVTKPQRASFTVTGGKGLAGKTVHVWSSDFSASSGPAHWFARQPDIKPAGGRFSLTILPHHVYSLTTTSGQGKGTAGSPRPASLRLPYRNNLSAGTDGQPALLAAQDGSFELAPCQAPDGSTACAGQAAVGEPVLWRVDQVPRHPYAIIGSDWASYAVSVDVMLPQPGSAGLIGRFHGVWPAHGLLRGYIFDVSTNGTFTLSRSDGGSGGPISLARGKVPFGAGTWHRLTLAMSGTAITASVDGSQVASLSSSALADGPPGIEVGGWYPAYFSRLVVRKP